MGNILIKAPFLKQHEQQQQKKTVLRYLNDVANIKFPLEILTRLIRTYKYGFLV